MYGVPQTGLTKPAVAGQLERGVRLHCGFTLKVLGWVMAVRLGEEHRRISLRAKDVGVLGLQAAAALDARRRQGACTAAAPQTD